MPELPFYNYKKLALPFKGSDTIEKNFSQSEQDLFVLTCLNGKTNGTFLDLGCNDPVKINNTYLLETAFEWTGLSIDINPVMTEKYSLRKTKTLTADATKLDFDNIINLLGTNKVDYLTLDLEPASLTYECLASIPFEKIEFSVITFEHDYYRFGNEWRKKSRELFSKHGYYALCRDVVSLGCVYEDWYVNPKYVDLDRVKVLESDIATSTEIFYKAR